jgi:hypothetical protein
MIKFLEFLDTPLGLVFTGLVAVTAGYVSAQYFTVQPAAAPATTK